MEGFKLVQDTMFAQNLGMAATLKPKDEDGRIPYHSARPLRPGLVGRGFPAARARH